MCGRSTRSVRNRRTEGDLHSPLRLDVPSLSYSPDIVNHVFIGHAHPSGGHTDGPSKHTSHPVVADPLHLRPRKRWAAARREGDPDPSRTAAVVRPVSHKRQETSS